jgi:hypothetical protein
MKKLGFLLIGIMMVSITSYAAANKLEDSLNSIENQYNELLRKEAAQKESYKKQIEQLKAEVEVLEEKRDGREKTIEKLSKDSEVRWHRDKYKVILKEFKKNNYNIEKMIAEKEQKITELETLLSVMD